MQVVRAVFSFSLLLWACLASAITYAELDRRLAQAKDLPAARQLLKSIEDELQADDDLWDQIDWVLKSESTQADLDDLRGMVRTRIALEKQPSGGKVQDPAKLARDIKKNPTYYDPGVGQSSNWLSKAFERVGEMLSRIRMPKGNAPDVSAPAVGVGNIFVTLVWIILGGGILAFLIWAIRQFSWKSGKRAKKIKGGGLMEEDEPERTADEWLVQADDLERQGRFREAVRCLYLACLVRLDEGGIARFVRSQTNWEHLYRIEASSKRPPGLDFRPPTKAFDIIWYGHLTQGASDVAMFRQTYQALCEQLNLRMSA
ncbi:MAG: hypothetical protein K1X67_18045 [Fimbriimonadaceae bacterium]|nr:hypothetical protein [Fimbriimonadaceae bacterium]